MFGIDVELDGAVHGLTVGIGSRQQIGTVGGIEGVLRTVRFAHIHNSVGLNIDQRLNELTLRVHCHLDLGGKGVAHCQQCQRHET